MQNTSSFTPSTSRSFVKNGVPDYVQYSDWPTVDGAAILEHGLAFGTENPDVAEWRKANRLNLLRGAWRIKAARALRVPHFYGTLWLDVLRASGEHIPLGLASMRMITDAGAAAIVDAFTNTFELETFNYHGIGTGATTEVAGNTALQTESSAITGGVRPTGTQSQPSAQVYRTVATFTATGSIAATEHGILSSATIGSGVLLDRATFAAVNLATSDTLQITFDFNSDSGS